MRKKFKILFFAILFLAFFCGGAAFASFDDNESSAGSVYSVGALYFSLGSPEDFSPEVTPLEDSIRNISIINNGSLLFKYGAQAVKTGGDDELCDALNLEAKLGGEIKYSGGLTDFNLDLPVEISADRDDWTFTVSLPAGASGDLQNKTCEFDFIFEGSQAGSSFGFSDTEEIKNVITAGAYSSLIINEVYYQEKNKNEWVEIYNKTDQPINVSGWTVEDNNSQDILPSADIPANGFGVIVTKNTKVSGIDPSAAIIKLNSANIGSGLNNSGDRLILRNLNGDEIDAMSYGNNTYAFDPSCGADSASASIIATSLTKGGDENDSGKNCNGDNDNDNEDEDEDENEDENQPEGKEEKEKGSFDPAKKESDGGDGDGDGNDDNDDDGEKDNEKSVDGIQAAE